jgi:cytochrome P450
VGFGIARRKVLQLLQRRYGHAFTVHLPIYGRTVVISDPALAKELFTAPQESLTNVDPNLGRVLGENSMFALEGTDHRRRRKLLTPPLHGRRITAYEATVEEETRRELDSWVSGRPFASMPSMTRLTLDVILRTVFGARGDELDTLRRVIPPMVEAGSAVVITPELPARLGTVGVGSLGPRARFARYKKVYDEAIGALITRGRRDDRLDERDDILAMMLQSTYEDGSSMTDDRSATSSPHSSLPGTRPRRRRSPGRWSGSAAHPRCFASWSPRSMPGDPTTAAPRSSRSSAAGR